MKEMNREMNREMELNMDELEQVNGGNSFCLGWGFVAGGDPAGAEACFTDGASTVAGDHGFGATACVIAVFGVGLGGVTC